MLMIRSWNAKIVALLGTVAALVPMPFTLRKIVWPVDKFSPLAIRPDPAIFSQSIPIAKHVEL